MSIEYYKDFGDGGLGESTLKAKYLDGEESEPADVWRRGAQAMATVEKAAVREQVNADFLWALTDWRFIPGGRIMHGAGTNFKSTLTNCYVIEIKGDSINAIYDTIRDEARTYKAGGGVGHDLSVLRPRGSKIGGTGGESCGPVGFMDLFSVNTNTISQHGRRGANMQTLRVDHPDIEEFINCKNDAGRTMVQYSNISVLITDDFMKALEANADFPLRWGGKVYRHVNARELWNKIVSLAHASAEPGIIFWDRMKQFHNLEYCAPLVSTNPCGEQPLPDGGNCNLGAINLAMMTKQNGTPGKHGVDWDTLRKTIFIGVRYMDNVIDYNADRHPLEQQKISALEQRRVGFGITGLADMLIKLHVPYDSEEALDIVEKVMEFIRNKTYEASIHLAKEKGSFPLFDLKEYRKSAFFKTLPQAIKTEIREHGIRNGTLLTVAPVGTGSIVAGTSSGIEPIFQTEYRRTVIDEKAVGGKKEFVAYHPLVHQWFILKGIPVPDYVRTSHDIDPHFRVRMQGVVQKYIDSSISSTVNLPKTATLEQVRGIYEFAYDKGLKGITVYREGSRDGILKSIDDVPKAVKSVHPYDSGELLRPTARPQRVGGITEKVYTGAGDMLVTINEDDLGRLVEVIARVGKAGGNEAALSEALGRLVSVACRSGMDPAVVIKQLKGISSIPVFHTFEGDSKSTRILSTPDGIAKVLERYLSNRTAIPTASAEVVVQEVVEDLSTAEYTQCPDCHDLSVIHENGCERCTACPWQRC
jgi:ribonucleoside-diphosphate reductase alpha chain